MRLLQFQYTIPTSFSQLLSENHRRFYKMVIIKLKIPQIIKEIIYITGDTKYIIKKPH